MTREPTLREVAAELERAERRFGPMASAHEGYAVVLEELDELWAEVKDNKRLPDEYRAAMRKEAMQVAAMALRFIVDCCEPETVEQVLDHREQRLVRGEM